MRGLALGGRQPERRPGSRRRLWTAGGWPARDWVCGPPRALASYAASSWSEDGEPGEVRLVQVVAQGSTVRSSSPPAPAQEGLGAETVGGPEGELGPCRHEKCQGTA